jgi:hypothetical protein
MMPRLTLPALFGIAGLASGWLLSPVFLPRPGNITAKPPSAGSPTASQNAKSSSLDESIQAVHAAGGPSAQMAAALRLAETLSPSDFEAMLEKARFLPAHSSQSIFMRTVLRRWVEADPSAAAQWCAGNATSQLPEALRLWSRQDAPGARRFLASLPMDVREKAVAACAAGMAESNPAAALQFLATQADSNWSGYSFKEAFRMLAENDPDWLCGNCDRLPSPLRQSAYEAAAASMADKNWSEAASWAMKQPNSDGLLRTVLTKAPDPATALQFLASLPESSQSSASNNLWKLTQKDPAGLMQALAATSSLSASAVNNLLSAAMEPLKSKNPAAAAAQLQAAFPFPEKLAEYAHSIAGSWFQQDAAAARTWVEGLPDGDAKTKALDSLAAAEAKSRQAEIPPTNAADRLLSGLQTDESMDHSKVLRLTADERRMALAKGAARSSSTFRDVMQTYHPEEYGRWLLAQGDDGGEAPNQNEVSEFSAKWAAEDPPSAAAWVLQIPNETARSQTAARVALQWAAVDPESAAKWIQLLPAGPVREAVEKSFERQN